MLKGLILALSLFLSFQALAGNPAPLYDRPVKLDDSGQPIVNSWEQYEYLRKNRNQQPGVQKQQNQNIDLPKPDVNNNQNQNQNINNKPMPVVNPHSASPQ